MAQTESWQRALEFLVMLVFHRRSPAEAQPIVEEAVTLVRRRHRREAEKMGKTYAQVLIEEGEAIGEARGEAIGEVRGKQESVLMLIRHKFGSVPEAVAARVRSLEVSETLDALFSRVFSAANLEDTGLTA